MLGIKAIRSTTKPMPIKDKTPVIVESNPQIQSSRSVLLNLNDSLSTIRDELLNQSIIYSNSLFLEKYKYDEKDQFSEIHINEKSRLLKDILYKDENILYVRVLPNLQYFDMKCKLGYGYIKIDNDFKKVENKAFFIENCELIETGSEECEEGMVKHDSKESRTMKTSLSFGASVDFNKLANLGSSFGKSKMDDSSLEKNISSRYIKYGKAYLILSKSLKPTPEFIDAVKNAISSKNPKQLLEIISIFGHFIPTKILLGGRVNFDSIDASDGHTTEDTKEITANIGAAGYLDAKGSYAPMLSEKKSSRNYQRCTKMVGGALPKSLSNFDESEWIASLNRDFKTWDVIELQEVVSIFQPLQDSLCKQINKLLGKKLLYHFYEDINYTPKLDATLKVELTELPSEILKTLENKDADCSIFVTVSDTESNNKEVFSTSVLYPSNETPSLLVNCLQVGSQTQQYKLKIACMIVGYLTDYLQLNDYQTTYQLVVIKTNFYEEYSSNTHKIKTKLLDCEYDVHTTSLPLLGASIMTDLNNKSFVIGHRFYTTNKENKIGACVFCFSTEYGCYVELPPFTFDVLVIKKFNQSNTCGVTLLKNSKHIFSVENGPPKFISPINNNSNASGPIYLKQNSTMIQAHHIYCRNNYNCTVCYNDRKLKGGRINCSIIDPRYLFCILFIILSNNVLVTNIGF
ncbi:hypothetical protein RclHR1_28710001 [Rhizophagus clarus]|uniref:MACPF domain-containing protein n=1 Tax=Rhizophagus clarus TaxID=94130 RepID=A0A2Z6RJK9_9GLOM|nr:hypothetical protein RclHR1_28710001 [Rhizophagus clarus]GES99684.1 hypothetical protein GLOIN_2v1472953 [Rhizophagus clarus]